MGTFFVLPFPYHIYDEYILLYFTIFILQINSSVYCSDYDPTCKAWGQITEYIVDLSVRIGQIELHLDQTPH